MMKKLADISTFETLMNEQSSSVSFNSSDKFTGVFDELDKRLDDLDDAISYADRAERHKNEDEYDAAAHKVQKAWFRVYLQADKVRKTEGELTSAQQDLLAEVDEFKEKVQRIRDKAGFNN